MIEHRQRLCWLGVAVVLAATSGCAALRPAEAPALRERAAAAYAAGELEAAVAAYRGYLEMAPRDPHAWYRLGNALARLGRLREAESAYYRSLSLDPGLPRARHNLGLVQMQLGWRSLLEARRHLPDVDNAARDTMRYLACVMQVLQGHPRSVLCKGPSTDEESDD